MLASRPEPAQPQTTSMGGPRSPGAMPASDPTYPILSGLLGVVPASRWTVARVAPNGGLVSLYGSRANGKGLAWLADELRRQRSKCPTGPRIAATLESLDRLRERHYAGICRRAHAFRVSSPSCGWPTWG